MFLDCASILRSWSFVIKSWDPADWQQFFGADVWELNAVLLRTRVPCAAMGICLEIKGPVQHYDNVRCQGRACTCIVPASCAPYVQLNGRTGPIVT
jgi:hypothetical protein